ncbi:bifunctional enoyl-CoA hydratase/phosphate acetyltransferase [Pelomicrobium methylotrophicum]|uniref:bifunctional enoyl-CoA hydratase/phosphate acetyltransferase n=1 Tax=Pelomicrobium methylotrophicum TaxID=2602750 RepID=UPI001969DBA3
MTQPFGRCQPLIDQARARGPVVTAVVYPVSREGVLGAVESARLGLIRPLLVGPGEAIRRAAAEAGADLAGCTLIEEADPVACATRAAALVRSGEAEVIMKGSLHTDELMGVVVSREAGLRTHRRISHVFVMDVAAYPKLLLITDAAVNIAPGLTTKRDIVQNAVGVAQVIGVEVPRVALLSAVETVNPDIPSTVEAAALCKMADRGQITGAILDGPLAFDNAISADAAKTKGITSPVSGQADVLVVPNLEAGNMLYKQLVYLSGALAAGVVVGARVPVVLTSRADTPASRIASTAVACLLARARTAQAE